MSTRELLPVDEATWEKLPKDVVGAPVFCRIFADRIEVWPKWGEDSLTYMISYPRIWIE